MARDLGLRDDGDREVAARAGARQTDRCISAAPAARRSSQPTRRNTRGTGRRRGGTASVRACRRPGTILHVPDAPGDAPGPSRNCPMCGMALEPEMPTLDEGENPELVDFRRRFWWTLPLTRRRRRARDGGHRLQLLGIATPELGRARACRRRSCSGRAGRSSCAASQSIVNRSPNMWTLIGLGVAAAFVYSVVATVAPGVFPAVFVAHGPRRRLLRGGGGDRLADAARASCWSCARARRRRRRSSALLGLAPKTARRIARRRHRRGRPADARAGRRPPARAAGREGAGRRRRRSKAQLERRRIDAHRRADAGREARRATSSSARRINGTRQPRDARREGRRARPCSRRSCRWWRRRSAAARRCSAWPIAVVVLVRARRGRRSRSLTFVAWGLLGPRAALGLRAGQRGGGADHRLPVRARPGDADVDHGGDRPAATQRRAVPRRRGDRDAAQDRHADRRQDRHAHGGQAGVRSRRRRRRASTEDEVLRLAASLDQGSEHPLADAIVARRASAVSRSTRPKDFESSTGIGVRGSVDGQRGRARQHRADAGASASTSTPLRDAGRGAARGRRERDVPRRRRRSSAGLLAVADPIKDSDAGGDRGAARRRHPHRHGDRRRR